MSVTAAIKPPCSQTPLLLDPSASPSLAWTLPIYPPPSSVTVNQFPTRLHDGPTSQPSQPTTLARSCGDAAHQSLGIGFRGGADASDLESPTPKRESLFGSYQSDPGYLAQPRLLGTLEGPAALHATQCRDRQHCCGPQHVSSNQERWRVGAAGGPVALPDADVPRQLTHQHASTSAMDVRQPASTAWLLGGPQGCWAAAGDAGGAAVVQLPGISTDGAALAGAPGSAATPLPPRALPRPPPQEPPLEPWRLQARVGNPNSRCSSAGGGSGGSGSSSACSSRSSGGGGKGVVAAAAVGTSFGGGGVRTASQITYQITAAQRHRAASLIQATWRASRVRR
ncbi:hypothetical protein Agub_g1419, partial [Astrephomene gubernaculifera]